MLTHKRPLIIVFSMLIILSVLFASTACTAQSAHPMKPALASPVCAECISFHGGKRFLIGYDYPWHRYSYDFSVSRINVHGQYAAINSQFADLSANGTHVTRWFVFNNFSQNPLLDTRGYVIGLSPGFFQSFDDALAIARAHHIYLILDFTDGTTLLANDNNDPQLHSKIFTDLAIRQSFFDKGVKPILQRYGQDPNIIAWSPINEPDYEVIGIGADSTHVGIPYQAMKDFMSQFTLYVHTYTHQMATIENGPLHFTHFWMRLDFDFYSPHYYDWMKSFWPNSDPVTNRAASFHLDKPIVLGELPSAFSKYSVTQLLNALYANGYAGALFWSMNAGDYVTNYLGTKAEFNAWSRAHSADVDI